MIKLRKNKFYKNIDFWILVITIFLSISAFYIFYTSGQKNLADYDAIARLNIARKVFDSLTPGIAQLGGIWLPFPQVLFMPFIWNNYLWHSGIAGAISSMSAFILGSYFLYKTVFLITNKKIGGILAWLTYITNINILFLQSMAMSESFFLFTMIMVIYLLTKWTKSNNLLDLIYAGFFVILTTLTRYEGYALFGASSLSVTLVILAVYGKSNIKKLEGLLILFMTFAGFGIFLWSIYSFLIFKDPIYWLNLYSGNKEIIALDPTEINQVINNVTIATKQLSLLNSVKIYGSAMAFMNGVLLTILALLGFNFLILRSIFNIYRKKLEILTIPTIIVAICIFSFLVIGYFKSFIPIIETPLLTISNIFNKNLNFGSSSNIRYGIIILPLVALIIGLSYSRSKILVLLTLVVIIFQTYTIFSTPLFLTFSLAKKDAYQQFSSVDWFKANYDGGLILTSANRHENFIFQTGLTYKNFIYEGNQKIWRNSLKDPSKYARWVVMDTVDTGDAVNMLIEDKSILDTKYQVVFKEANLVIFKIK